VKNYRLVLCCHISTPELALNSAIIIVKFSEKRKIKLMNRLFLD